MGYQEIPGSPQESQSEAGVFPEPVPIPGRRGVHHRGPVFSSDFTHRRSDPTADDRTEERADYDPTRSEESMTAERQELRDVTYSRGISDQTREVELLDNPSNYVDRKTTEGTEDDLVSVIEKFVWRLSGYTECTRPCGGGTSRIPSFLQPSKTPTIVTGYYIS